MLSPIVVLSATSLMTADVTTSEEMGSVGGLDGGGGGASAGFSSSSFTFTSCGFAGGSGVGRGGRSASSAAASLTTASSMRGNGSGARVLLSAEDFDELEQKCWDELCVQPDRRNYEPDGVELDVCQRVAPEQRMDSSVRCK